MAFVVIGLLIVFCFIVKNLDLFPENIAGGEGVEGRENQRKYKVKKRNLKQVDRKSKSHRKVYSAS